MTAPRSLPRELLHLAWPVLIAQAAVMANSVIDTLMAGRLSSLDLAAVGIGAFLAAATHAPLTAIFLLFEMTGNYLIIVPIMLASIIGTVVAARLNPDSIDTVDFSREGIDLHEGREISVMKSIMVGRVISEEVDFISEQANAG